MEELYILGNGFDLYLELETRYEDYFNSRKLDENFFKKLENIYKKNYQYGKNNKCKKVLVIVDNIGLRTEIEELYNKYKIENLFYLYLSFLKKENLNWNEVESNIKKFIIYTNESLKKTVENILENAEMNKLYIYILVSKIIILKKIDEIKNENENKRNDEEKREFNYLDFMMEQLNLFEKDFGNYIGSLELKEENKNRLINIFRTTCRKKIINFNYSIFLQDLIDKYKDIVFSEIEILRRIKPIESIVNIHGDFKNPIFGIDSHNSEEQFQNFTKTSRILNNDTVGNFELPKPGKLGTINFFGHSLSEADYSYFQSLFDYYDIYSSNIKLNFMYSEYDKNDLTRAKRETHNNVVKLMKNYGEKLENKDKGKNLLHKLLIENRIKLINVDKENKIIDNSNYSFN